MDIIIYNITLSAILLHYPPPLPDFQLLRVMAFEPLGLRRESLGRGLIIQVNKKFHKFERVCRDCIKRTRDKTRIHCIPHDAAGT